MIRPVALKYWDDIPWGIVKSYGQMKCSLALVDNHLEMVSRQKYRWLCNLKFTIPLMSEMLNQDSESNSVNRAGPVGEGSSPGSTGGTRSSSYYCQNKVV